MLLSPHRTCRYPTPPRMAHLMPGDGKTDLDDKSVGALNGHVVVISPVDQINNVAAGDGC